MNAALEDALIDLLVQRMAATVMAASIVDWATAALLAGEDTPSLVILAGLERDASVFDAAPRLDRALSELNVPSPAPADLRRAYVGMVSRALIAGRVTPREALDRIHQHAVTPLGHPPDLSPWCFVWEGLAPTDYRELSAAEVDMEARRLAEVWARHPGLSTRLPDDVARVADPRASS
jgi:hypothetical protein